MDLPENTEEESTVQNPWLKSCLEDWDDLEKEYPQLEVSTKKIFLKLKVLFYFFSFVLVPFLIKPNTLSSIKLLTIKKYSLLHFLLQSNYG